MASIEYPLTHRVKLNLMQVRQLCSQRKLVELAASIPSGRQQKQGWEARGMLHPSALSRILNGSRHPQLQTALSLAKALGVDPFEIILGYVKPSATPWLSEILAKARISSATYPMLDGLFAIAQHLHLGSVVEGGEYRAAFPVAGDSGYLELCFSALPPDTGVIVSLSQPLQEGISLLCDLGRLEVHGAAASFQDFLTQQHFTTKHNPDHPLKARLRVGSQPRTLYLRSTKPFRCEVSAGFSLDIRAGLVWVCELLSSRNRSSLQSSSSPYGFGCARVTSAPRFSNPSIRKVMMR